MKKKILLVGILGVLCLILYYYFHIYRVDGTSMNYGLLDGDIIITRTHIKTIERGDLLVIRHPKDPGGRLYLKRCAAIGGDRYFEEKRLFYLQLESNSTKTLQWAQTYGLPYIKRQEGYFLKEPYAKYYGVVHDWGLLVPRPLREIPLQQVKKDHYLMLGDFRDNSADSRFFGAVPRKWVRSKVIYILKRPRSWKVLLSIKEADGE